MPVFRAVVAIVAVAMLTISGSSALQHVHGYADHDHPDHHHGLASHTHRPLARQLQHDFEGLDHAAQLDGCDPGTHVVSVVFTGVVPRSEPAPVPVMLETVVVSFTEHVWRTVTPSDVRAHSPPRLTDAPLRAPPLVHPA
jgi:hypothetical protein